MAYDFYNNERKEAFLQTVNENIVNTYKVLFSHSAPMENLYGIDLCEFTLKNLQDMFVSNKWFSRSTFNVHRGLVRKYVNWCMDAGLCCNINAAQSLTLKSLGKESIRKSMYKDPDSLVATINELYGSAEDLDKNIMDVACWYLAWCGFTRDECLQIKQSQVFSDKIVGDTWTAENIHPDMMRVLITARDIREVDVSISTLKHSFVSTRKFVDNEFLLRILITRNTIRNHQTMPSNIESWTNRAKKLLRNLPNSSPYKLKLLTYTKVFNCGRYYALYQWEQENEEATMKNAKEWCSMVRSNIPGSNKPKTSTSVFLSSYKEWKAAFFPS
ncbi:MAG: hypothetical protein MR896_05485 [Clostridiales bacterium]|nr:hypothetical protein [Clostridiales bacterium]